MREATPKQLKRELSTTGAILLGLGSIIGTGVFVSLSVAAGVAGPAVVLAIVIAAAVALCNGLSSAQLAASHPVSGGTYEYGYQYLNPWMGFIAGWLFLLAKSASAATAALGFSGYLLSCLGITDRHWLVPVALLGLVLLTLVVLKGIQRSNQTNAVIVAITLLSLGYFLIVGLKPWSNAGFANFVPFFADNPIGNLLQATALMFVAFTGYGRLATLGEEVRAPRTTIPRAILITLLVTMGLYLGVALVGVGAFGAANLGDVAQSAAPLEAVVRWLGVPGGTLILTLGALAAMLGVLLNLLLGLSRVLLAMGRRGDMPEQVARLNRAGTSPTTAVIVMAIAIGILVLTGNVKTTWSFSAFNVLIYYAVTNLAALKMPARQRLYPEWIAWIGLVACLLLAFWVDFQIWLVGLGLILAGVLWKGLMNTLAERE